MPFIDSPQTHRNNMVDAELRVRKDILQVGSLTDEIRCILRAAELCTLRARLPDFDSMMITQPVPNASYKRSFPVSTRFWRRDSSRVLVSNGATSSGTEHCFTRAQSSSIHDLRVCIMYTTEKDSGQSRFRRCEALSRHLVSRYLKIC